MQSKKPEDARPFNHNVHHLIPAVYTDYACSIMHSCYFVLKRGIRSCNLFCHTLLHEPAAVSTLAEDQKQVKLTHFGTAHFGITHHFTLVTTKTSGTWRKVTEIPSPMQSPLVVGRSPHKSPLVTGKPKHTVTVYMSMQCSREMHMHMHHRILAA